MLQNGTLFLHASHENMGDLLMLACALEEVVRRTAITPIIPSGYNSQSIQCLPRGLYQQINYNDQSIITRGSMKIAHGTHRNAASQHIIAAQKLRTKTSIPRIARINKALDICGFAFGDQWGASNAMKHLKEYRRLTNKGVEIIKLPASFGPFEDSGTRDVAREALSMCSLIFARDRESLKHLQSIVPDTSKLAYCPDYSLAIPGGNNDARLRHEKLVIIPNFRMIDKQGFHDPTINYTEMIRGVIEYAISELRLTVSVVLHDHGADLRYASEAGLIKDARINVVLMHDPISLKAFISTATAVFSSRYHGAANAMSQGVPCIGTSWSHKYEHLFHEYNQDELLISRSCSDPLTQIKTLLRNIMDGKAGLPDTNAISRIKEEVGKMWDLVSSKLAEN
jgi:colanic acid/amylovoran biosynthesis protein